VANTNSAKKRIQVAERNRMENKTYRSAVRTLIKRCFSQCDDYENNPSENGKKEIQLSVNEAFSKIDKAVKRGVLHPNNGAHQKSRLSSVIKKIT
tara:strand:+ start:10568 stop:10852 length:285 start_codon:yes stop_codon:yes gene_type:complete